MCRERAFLTPFLAPQPYGLARSALDTLRLIAERAAWVSRQPSSPAFRVAAGPPAQWFPQRVVPRLEHALIADGAGFFPRSSPIYSCSAVFCRLAVGPANETAGEDLE